MKRLITMKRWIAALMLALATIATAGPAMADPSDIDAAARGVVRVVIVGSDGEELFLVGHGSGFAVSPTMVVTNNHVIEEATRDPRLRVGIVPSDGAEGSFARIVSTRSESDLALLEITEGLRLPPLTLAGAVPADSSEAYAVGYPMNVDRAQGLSMGDLLRSQPPVKSRGFLSGTRPSREFDTILHTAAIGRGNSGGPLLDSCGRVLGVNSFGAETGGVDAEFFFAVSMQELRPFLRANGVSATVNEQPCRSLAEVEAAERQRLNAEQEDARSRLERSESARRDKLEQARLTATMEVQNESENHLALAFVLALVGFGAALAAWTLRAAEARWKPVVAALAAAIAIFAALAAWLTRPGVEDVERRVNAAMAEETETPQEAASEGTGDLTCTLEPDRSRITTAPAREVDFEWTATGCVNGRTQYGKLNGDWSRVLVPNEESTVSVNRYDPETRTYTVDRYLLGRAAMEEAREERGRYNAPSCNSDGGANRLGDLQGAVLSELPASPNERLVYRCEPRE
ncbi:serine protease [Qipengyuania sp. JC766]|uniref:S1C family serine protease n=1 Tax=Qipengyuania sp. JC766 TaxID=3232139 RepID=UPI0034583DC1